MFKNITALDFKILKLFSVDYMSEYSIREISIKCGLNYSHLHKKIKLLVNDDILTLEKRNQNNRIKFNAMNISAIKLLSFVEEMDSFYSNSLYSVFGLMIKEAIKIDPFVSIGLFGSRVSGKARDNSDWDVFMISNNDEIIKIMSKFPNVKNIELLVFSDKEFYNSLLSDEETVVKHIVRNKKIIYNPHPFYSMIYRWELSKNAKK